MGVWFGEIAGEGDRGDDIDQDTGGPLEDEVPLAEVFRADIQERHLPTLLDQAPVSRRPCW